MLKNDNIKGKLIVFEGLDCSFKETNSTRLYEYIKENITDKVKIFSFPNYKDDSSIFVKKYLMNRYGDASKLNPYLSSLWYIVDRADTIYTRNILDYYNEGYTIILDRYIGSNMIFQASKFETLKDKEYFIKWCEDIEISKLGLPKPDITIYLDMPVDISYPIMKARKHKSNTSTDGHEDNYEFMKNIESSAKTIIDILGWKVIPCSNYGEINSKDTIFDKILECIL